MGTAEEDLARLESALALVQGDLDRTVPDAPRLHVLIVPGDVWHTGYHFTAYVSGPDDRYFASHGSVLWGPTTDAAVYSVADAAQEYLAEMDWKVWPICQLHAHGVHVRPPATALDWIYEGGEITGPPVWWCRGDGGHDLATIGRLGPMRPTRRK